MERQNHTGESNLTGNILKGVAIGGGIIGGIFALPIILGFGSAGIVAGSAAASAQAAIGNVVAGSAFAGLQSLGMTGVLATGAVAGATTSAVAGGGFIINESLKNDKSEKKEWDDETKEGYNIILFNFISLI